MINDVQKLQTLHNIHNLVVLVILLASLLSKQKTQDILYSYFPLINFKNYFLYYYNMLFIFLIFASFLKEIALKKQTFSPFFFNISDDFH